jgi:2-methylcitrate dehydratase
MTELEDRSDAISLASAIADYARSFLVNNDSAIDMARYCLIDALGHGFEALRDPDCASLVGPLVPGAMMPGGARVPGTSLELDPPQAAFCLAAMFSRRAGSDDEPELLSRQAAGPLAALLATADYRARKAVMEGTSPPTVRDLLAATIKAISIQRALALPRNDRDHDGTGISALRLTPLAVAATAAADLGGTRAQIVSAMRYACIDGAMSAEADEPRDAGLGQWATADAISRAVRHACQAVVPGRSAPWTPADLHTMGPIGSLLGSKISSSQHPLGIGTIDRLATRQDRQGPELLRTRFRATVDRHFPARQAERIKLLFAAPERLDDLPLNELLAALVTNGAR